MCPGHTPQPWGSQPRRCTWVAGHVYKNFPELIQVAPQSRRVLIECGDTSVISPTREGCEPVRPCDEGQTDTQKTEVSTVPQWGCSRPQQWVAEG